MPAKIPARISADFAGERKTQAFEPNDHGDHDQAIVVNQMADGGYQVEQITRLKGPRLSQRDYGNVPVATRQ